MQENTANSTDEISLKDVILQVVRWYQTILSKWKTILVCCLIGGAIGLVYSLIVKPVYKAELTFALQDDKSSGGGLSGALGLASQFGVDVGGTTGGEFSGDNLLALMKSRSMIEKTLLTPVNYKGNVQTLAEVYIDFNNLRKKWKEDVELKDIKYPTNSDRSKFTVKQDSMLGVFYKSLLKNNLSVDKIDKKLSIISVKVNSTNELFSKRFTEILTQVVSDFYIQTKTEKAAKNVAILQRQTDSVRRMLNGSMAGAAASADVNPNPNPNLAILRVPSQRKQVDVTQNIAILQQLVTNLEIAKMSLLQETPLIQVIDKPILPLDKEGPGKRLSIIVGVLLGAVAAIVFISIRLFFNSVFKK